VPVSAVAGDGIVQLEDVLGALMPLGPRWYPAGVATDEPLTVRVAELVREAALGEMREELPHSVAVLVEEIDGQMIYVSLFVERNSQKGIVLGAKGARLAKIRAVARRQVEALVGHKVSLKIHVKVAKEWQRDPKALRRLGL
jgi:GTP-binding protein Era